ncbi:MAG TPA: hypothetical protein VHV51_22635, partial [Polyangiaceae bacterium]|nr:hypothetical protein [Polyangiaceae bacterium]
MPHLRLGYSTLICLLFSGGCGQSVGHAPAATNGGSTSTSGASSDRAGSSAIGPNGGSGSGASSGFPTDPNTMPTIAVDPSDVISDAPLSTAEPSFPSVTHPLAPHAVFGGHASPLPTNAFWENMVLSAGDLLTNAFPYHVYAKSDGLELSRPDMLTVADRYCYEAADSEIVLGASEAFSGHVAQSWDPLSVTLRYTAAGGAMTAPVVYGMAYATGIYAGLT